MMPRPSVHPPAIAARLLRLFTSNQQSELILGDLLEEFSGLASKAGPAFARRWFWRQILKTIGHLAVTEFRVAPWATTAAVIVGFSLRYFDSWLTERAIFAVLRLFSTFEHHFKIYLFFATNGIAIGHVIASLVLGCLVALVAKTREMVAIIMLGLILTIMIATSSAVWVARGQGSLLWTLPLYLADPFAIVIGGIIVRSHRSASRTLPSVVP
jgi:hypothetical protein